MTQPASEEEKKARYTVRYKSCEQCQQSKRMSTFGHGGDICIQCLRYLNDPSRHVPDINRKLFDINLPATIERLQKSVEEAQISHQEILQHVSQLTTRVSNLENRNLEPQVMEPPMESKDSEIQQIRKLMADTEAEKEIWKSRATKVEAELSVTQERIKILEQHGRAQQQILDHKALELEKLRRESNQVVMERDNVREKWEKQEIDAQSQKAQYIADVQRLKEALQHQEQKYIAEISLLETQIRDHQARMTLAAVEASNPEEYSPLPGRYQMSPSQGYGPLVGERRLVFEPSDRLLSSEVGPTDDPNRSDPPPRSTPRKPPSIKFPNPTPKKS